MKAVIQRVAEGSVTIGDEIVGQIGRGIVVLLGISRDDTAKDMEYITRKLLSLRLWPNADGTKKWELNVKQIDGGILLVSQFTLMHVIQGNKPDFHLAMNAVDAKEMFHQIRDTLKKEYKEEKIATGRYQTYTHVNIVNDGPLTLVLDSTIKK